MVAEKAKTKSTNHLTQVLSQAETLKIVRINQWQIKNWRSDPNTSKFVQLIKIKETVSASDNSKKADRYISQDKPHRAVVADAVSPALKTSS